MDERSEAKFYLFTTGTDYEGEVPRGLYSSFEKAKEVANSVTPQTFFLEDTVNIYILEPEYDYDYNPPCIWSKRIKDGKMYIGTNGDVNG